MTIWNWWLSGWAGAVMARQGYYMSVPELRCAAADARGMGLLVGPLPPDLPGPDGSIVARAGGGGRRVAMNAPAVSRSEHRHRRIQYAARAWRKFVQHRWDPA